MSQTTILIVEDEAIVAADLQNKLRQLDYDVTGVTLRGEEALALVRARRPDLVLMDIRLAGPLDGIETAARMRSEFDLPVVYLTAPSDEATLHRAKLTEPFGYILKPFDERELSSHIELALYKHKVDQELREQREWLRVTLTSIGDAVLATDNAGQVTFLNPVAETLTGWPQAEALGQPFAKVFRIINELTQAPAEDIVARVLHEGVVVGLANHTALVTRDGRQVPIADSAAPIKDSAGRVRGVVLVFRDVTEQRRARQEREQREAELGRLNRTLRALSNSNQALMRTQDETQLLNEVCEIVVRDCGHPMVWIGFAEPDEARTIRPVASAGFEVGYLETLNLTWADTERGRGPSGTAIRTGQPSVCANMATDPRFVPWREEALRRGYGSSVVLPLLDQGRAFGVLNIYARHPDAFSKEEISLLAELTGDLAYGLTTLRLRQAHERAEQRLHQLNEQLETRVQERTAELAQAMREVQSGRRRFHDVLDQLPAYVVLLTPDYHVPFANRFFEERFGKSEGRRCYEYLFNRTAPCEVCDTYSVLKTRVPHRWEWTGPDGHNYDIYDYPFTDADGSTLIMEVGLDITEIKKAQATVRAERQRFLAVLDSLPARISLLTPDHHVAFANRSFRQKFGEAQGRRCFEYCYGRTEPCAFCESLTVLQTGQPHHWTYTAPDGTTVAAHDFPFTDPDGSPLILKMDVETAASGKAGEPA